MKPSARLLVIINHAAARAREAWPHVRAALEGAGLSFSAHESVRPGETEARTRAALIEGYRTVAVVGGDGTLSAAASGYFHPCDSPGTDGLPRAVNPAAALALLPAGTGDDFARGLAGGSRLPLDAWLARLINHCSDAREENVEATHAVDLFFVTADAGARRFLCLNAATLGIGAEVAARVAAQRKMLRRLSGEARFALAAARSLAAWRNRMVRIALDGSTWRECATNLIAVANGPFAGGGMNFAPAAKLDDGWLDVVTACGLTRAEVVRELMRVHRAGHLDNPRVTLASASRVRIETIDESRPLPIEADGDPRGHTPAEFVVLPSSLRVVR